MAPSTDKPTIVITGASSGIGRATAHHFARKGWNLVLAARRAEMLDDAGRECVALGGTVLTPTTDMSVEEQVEALGRQAIARFGASMSGSTMRASASSAGSNPSRWMRGAG
jgi:NAD(P)-dependent dehydrogenase (short-subunit alcohol dehydrogenase family)